ncbi:EAL domain-containing protein [Thermocrinis sp.]
MKTIGSNIFNTKLADISAKMDPIHQKTLIRDVFYSIMDNSKWDILPIVDYDGTVVGQIERNSFIEHTILGRYGYGIHLNGRKFIYEVMEPPELVFESYETLENSAIKLRDKIKENDRLPRNIIVVENGKLIGAVYVSVLLEALAQKNLQLMKDSNPLTGLPGNWAIKNEVEKRISEGKVFKAIYIDINNFKPFNDHYGFAQGDSVIFAIGEILKEIAGRYKNLFVGHVGGDDFILICPDGISAQVAEEIKTAFEKHLPNFHGEDYKVGFYISKDRSGLKKKFPLLSLSLAIVSNKHIKITSYAHLASIASEIKTKAKLLAKGSQSSVIFKDRRKDGSDNYNPDLILSRITIDMYFQPIVDLNSLRVLGFEALVRGVDQKDGSIIPPHTLFELAERTNTLVEFDRRCMDFAMKKFRDFGLDKDFLLFLNVSSEVIDLGLAGTDWLKRRAEYYGMNPRSIVIEINESKIQDMENLIRFADNYHSYGFSLAMDDFGTNHANIERLLFVEPEYIKIPRDLIRGIHTDKRKQKLLEVMKFLSREFCARIIPEGIETPEEAYFVKHHGFDLAQGYLFAHPQSNPREALLLAEKKLKELFLS